MDAATLTAIATALINSAELIHTEWVFTFEGVSFGATIYEGHWVVFNMETSGLFGRSLQLLQAVEAMIQVHLEDLREAA